MDFNEENEPEEQQGYDIEIYSRRAIWGFSIFFSTIFGGVLMMLNLRAAGYKKEGYMALLFSIAYLLISSVLMGIIGVNGFVALIFNGVGAYILTEYFFNKYFPETDYYPKSIVVPLIVSILICIPIVWFAYHYGPAGVAK